jgi:hypothetical protein
MGHASAAAGRMPDCLLQGHLSNRNHFADDAYGWHAYSHRPFVRRTRADVYDQITPTVSLFYGDVSGFLTFSRTLAFQSTFAINPEDRQSACSRASLQQAGERLPWVMRMLWAHDMLVSLISANEQVQSRFSHQGHIRQVGPSFAAFSSSYETIILLQVALRPTVSSTAQRGSHLMHAAAPSLQLLFSALLTI